MAVINTGLLTRDARSEFFNRLGAFDAAAIYQRLATRIASTKDQENYRWLGTVPQMREWGTGRVLKGLRSESYDVANLKYEASLEIDRDEISDDQTGQIRIRINELAQRAASHKDYLLAQLLIYGATTGFNSYDGVTFFNDTHVSGASGNQDNKRTRAIVNKDNPTSAEMKAAINEMIEVLMTLKDDQGEPMNLSASGLVVIVPWRMNLAAREAMTAAMLSSTTNVMVGVAEVLPLPWLTATDTFYLLKTDGIIRPFIFQDREPIEFNSLAEGSDEEFLREKYIYGVRARYRMTYGYWQYAVQMVYTTA